MLDELTEVFESAIYKEVAAQALYQAAQDKTDDPSAKAMLQELMKEEAGHAQKLKKLREKGFTRKNWHSERIHDLKISDYLTGTNTLESAGLQDTLIFAMKREQEAAEFYIRLDGILSDENAKQLCATLLQEEMKHKIRLELLYDDLFYIDE